ncbi:MAG TPA: hypothetical protein VIH29_09605 [Gallionella sp.]
MAEVSPDSIAFHPGYVRYEHKPAAEMVAELLNRAPNLEFNGG